MTGNHVYEIKVKKFANSEPKSLILYKNPLVRGRGWFDLWRKKLEVGNLV